MSDIAALLERVRAATGPDRELDAAIFLELRLDPAVSNASKHPGIVLDGSGNLYAVKPYTASVDAALALVGRALPGCGIVVDREPVAKGGAPAGARIWGWIGEEGPEGLAWDDVDATGASFPLAILAALLLALKDQPHD